MPEQHLTEGTTSFVTNSDEKITKDMPVFYNPVMKLNRDLTLAVLLALNAQRNSGTTPPKRGLRIGLPMEASGIRAARILHELVGPGYIVPALIALNDISQTAVDFAKQNVAHTIGTFDQKKVNINVADASAFLRGSPGYDYADIDPFGTPNPFLDAAVQRVTINGVLAVTATDTSALAGTYPGATARKYWAKPTRTWLMHDAGLRILCRKVQLIGAQYEVPLVPVLSVATDHYYRIFFQRVSGNTHVKDVLAQHKFLHVCNACMQTAVSSANWGQCGSCGTRVVGAGPLWVGQLQDAEFVKLMRAELHKLDAKTAKELDRLLAVIEDEARIDVVGFYDIHELCSRIKRQAPRTEDVLAKLGEKGCRTHVVGHGVKTTLSVQELAKLIPV